MAFFTYIAGGFGNNIDSQIQAIASESGVPGSAISVTNIIKMVEENESRLYSHQTIRALLSANRQVLLSDL